MIGSLSGSQVIGGVVVTIGADTSALRAGEREAMAIGQRIEKLLPVVKIKYLIEKPTAAQLALPGPVTVPLLFDTRLAIAQIALLQRLAQQPISITLLPQTGSVIGSSAQQMTLPPSAPRLALPAPMLPSAGYGVLARSPSSTGRSGPEWAGVGWGSRGYDEIIDAEYSVRPRSIGAPPGQLALPSPVENYGPSRIKIGPPGSMPTGGARMSDAERAKWQADAAAEHQAYINRVVQDFKGQSGGMGAPSLPKSSLPGGVSAGEVASGALGAHAAGFTPRGIAVGTGVIMAAAAGSQWLADATTPGVGMRGATRKAVETVDYATLGIGSNLLTAQRNWARHTGNTPSLGDWIVQGTNAIGLTDTMTFADEEAFARDDAAVQSRNRQRLQRIAEQAATQGTKRQTIIGAEDAMATLGMTSADASVYTARKAAERFQTSMVGKKWGAIDYATLGALQDQETVAWRIGYADINRRSEIGAIETRGIQRGGDIALMRAGGDIRGAARAEIMGQRDDQIGALQAELDEMNALGSTDYVGKRNLSEKIKAIRSAADKQLQAMDDALGREEGQIIAANASAVKVIGLQADGNIFEARQQQITDAYAPQIENARLNKQWDLARSLEERRDAELEANRIRRARDTSAAIEQIEAQTSATRLQIVGKSTAAELELFDAQAKERIRILREGGSGAGVIAAEEKLIGAQRDAILNQQGRDRGLFDLDQKARRYIAGIDPNQQMLAGVASRIFGMEAELASKTDPRERRELAITQQAELAALTKSILTSNQYAIEGDRNREARGPGSGDQQQKALDIIATHLKSILDKMANGTLGP